MPVRIEGGCACGAVRYRSPEAPKFSFHCHCRQCQQATGTGHSSLLMVPAASLEVEGELKFFETAADSGNAVSHGFCPNCGCPLISFSAGFPDNRYVMVGSLDDPGGFAPQKAIFVDSAHSWDHMDPKLAD